MVAFAELKHSILLLALLCVPAWALEQRPVSSEQINAALAAGERARQSGKVEGMPLPTSALIVKNGGVRSGHAIVRVEAAPPESHASYRLVESFKAAAAEGTQFAVVDYSGTYLLDEHLGVISAELETRQELQDPSNQRKQVTRLLGSMSIKDGNLVWQRRAVDENGKETNATSVHELKVGTVRPLPRNALAALPKLMLANGALEIAAADKTPALCVPCVDLDWEMNDLMLDAAWLTFDKPVYTNPKGSAFQMRARYMGADIEDNRLIVETPPPAMWAAYQNWAFAPSCAILQHPSPGSIHVEVETVDAATLDVNVPLDLQAIQKAMEK
jgi:hypothetical protein